MAYVIHSKALKALAPFANRFRNRPALCAGCRVMRGILLLLCYIGMLVAPTAVCGMMLQALHRFPVIFWISAALLSVTALWFACVAGRRILRELPQRFIDADLAVGFAAFVLAVAFIVVTLSSGFFFKS